MDDNTQLHIAKIAAIEKYLSYGWATVPLHYITPMGICSCVLGAACRSAGKHPIAREWQIDVVREIDHWVGALTCAPLNVGIATGSPSGFWGLDFDPAHVVDDAAHEIVKRLADEQLLPQVRTGGGGDHWRFRLPDFEVTAGMNKGLPAGFDIRGRGGQMVAPPSVSSKGAYVEMSGALPWDAPDWLLDMIRPRTAVSEVTQAPAAGWSSGLPIPVGSIDDRGTRYARATVSGLLDELGNAESNRNDLAFRVACRIVELINAGWVDFGQAYVDWEAATLAHPAGIIVPDGEVRAIWASARRTVGDRPAVLGADPLDLSYAVMPPLPPREPPPFSDSSNGAGLYVVDPLPVPETVDPREALIAREVLRMEIRAEAQKRVREAEIGDRRTALERLRGELLDAAAMRSRPRLRPLVAGLLYRNTLARVNGPSGHGKSFVMLDLAARIAAGMSWAGRAVEQGPVWYVVAEGDEGVGARMDAWEIHHERRIEGVTYLPRALQLDAPEWDLFVELAATARPAAIVVDTQARSTVGLDENDARDMGRAVAALDRLRAATGACVLLVHHTGRTGTHGRGSTAVTGALQTELMVSKQGRLITVRTGKSKDGPEPDDVEFELTDVAGAPVEADGLMIVTPGPVGVVPVWLGEAGLRAPSGVDERPIEPLSRTRARELYAAILEYANPGEGRTEAQIRALVADRPSFGPNVNARTKALTKAWNVLIGLGLLAKSVGAARFKVVVVEDQSPDGVLTSNAAGLAEPPEGFFTLRISDHDH